MAIPIKYNLRSLFVRRISTLMTILSIAMVVAIFIGVMSLASGLENALVTSGDPSNILVRRRGSDSELSSSVSREGFQAIRYLDGVKTDGGGEPISAAEIVIIINLPKRGEEQGSNVIIRGVGPGGISLRPQFKVVEGRMFQPGLREAIVSRAISQRFQQTALGDHLPFGKGDWSVVGMFEAGNTAFDSEIWVDVNQLASDYNRTTYSSALLRAADPQSIDDLISRIEADRRYDLTAQRELAYYEEQTASAGPIKALGYFIAIVMGIGACFAAMNTMYAAVSYRSREIATLLILGYRRYAILFSFMVEALILSVSGGIIGCLLSLPVNGITTGTANWQTFSEVAFAFQVTPQLLIGGIIFSLLMGLLGGFFPASRASRQKPAFTMREA